MDAPTCLGASLTDTYLRVCSFFEVELNLLDAGEDSYRMQYSQRRPIYKLAARLYHTFNCEESEGQPPGYWLAYYMRNAIICMNKIPPKGIPATTLQRIIRWCTPAVL